MLSSRNVATSRVVSMFGLNETVAPSQMVVVKKSGEADKYGTAMKIAEGKQIDKFSLAERTDATIAPEVIRRLGNLQVLDYLCGQIDRHEGNFMLQSEVRENGRVHFTGMTAFDNDMAFGVLTSEKIESDLTKGKYNHLPSFKNTEGQCSMPHMDEQTYHTIMNLDASVLRFSLQDLLNSQELDAMVERLAFMKDVLMRTVEARPGFLVGADGWSAEKCAAMTRQEGGYAGLVASKIRHSQ